MHSVLDQSVTVLIEGYHSGVTGKENRHDNVHVPARLSTSPLLSYIHRPPVRSHYHCLLQTKNVL
jgi:hypothetical protein